MFLRTVTAQDGGDKPLCAAELGATLDPEFGRSREVSSTPAPDDATREGAKAGNPYT
jgi:hypothetical protein